jgi:tetratricopeptide (TPR) repeat protein
MLPNRWLSLVLCLFAVQTAAAAMPKASQPRAALMESWRTKIAAAERAAESQRDAEAERLYREVLDESGASDEVGLLAARAVDGLADLCRKQERLEEARELYLRAAGLWESLLGPGQPRLAVTLHNLGVVETARGEFIAAKGHLQRALEIWELSYGAESEQARNTRRAQRLLQRRSADLPDGRADLSP